MNIIVSWLLLKNIKHVIVSLRGRTNWLFTLNLFVHHPLESSFILRWVIPSFNPSINSEDESRFAKEKFTFSIIRLNSVLKNHIYKKLWLFILLNKKYSTVIFSFLKFQSPFLAVHYRQRPPNCTQRHRPHIMVKSSMGRQFSNVNYFYFASLGLKKVNQRKIVYPVLKSQAFDIIIRILKLKCSWLVKICSVFFM